MSDYEDSEELPQRKNRQPPPYSVGETVVYASPVTGRDQLVQFRGWDGDIAAVQSPTLGFIRVLLRHLRKYGGEHV